MTPCGSQFLNIVIAAMPPRERAERRLPTITQCDTARVSRANRKDQYDVIDFPRFRLLKAAKCSDGFDDPIEFSRFPNSGSSQINRTAFWLCPSRWPGCQQPLPRLRERFGDLTGSPIFAG